MQVLLRIRVAARILGRTYIKKLMNRRLCCAICVSLHYTNCPCTHCTVATLRRLSVCHCTTPTACNSCLLSGWLNLSLKKAWRQPLSTTMFKSGSRPGLQTNNLRTSSPKKPTRYELCCTNSHYMPLHRASCPYACHTTALTKPLH
jgi:hypothetical protein